MAETKTAQPDMETAMAEYAKYATPGAEHEELSKIAGTWTAELKHWMSPDAPASESKGEAEFKSMFGGRYLKQTFKSEFMGQTFEGMGLTGYNKYRGEYNHLWIDSMGTSMTFSTGKAEDGGKKIIYTATMDDPGQDRKDVPFKMVEQRIDDDTIKIEMFCTDASGKEFQNMEIIYTRKN